MNHEKGRELKTSSCILFIRGSYSFNKEGYELTGGEGDS